MRGKSNEHRKLTHYSGVIIFPFKIKKSRCIAGFLVIICHEF